MIMRQKNDFFLYTNGKRCDPLASNLPFPKSFETLIMKETIGLHYQDMKSPHFITRRFMTNVNKNHMTPSIVAGELLVRLKAVLLNRALIFIHRKTSYAKVIGRRLEAWEVDLNKH